MHLFIKKTRKRLCKLTCPRRRNKNIVIVFPLNIAEKKIILIQEYVYYYDKFIWKFVSGGIDKDDKNIKQHAVEELEEEIGMRADNFYEYYFFEKIFKFREIHCYVAENPIEVIAPPKNPDHKFGNYINDIKWVNYDELQTMIDNHEIVWNESVLVALNLLRSLE